MKLKPCPFCGENDDLWVSVHGITCGNCGARAGSQDKTEAISREIWNTRTQKTDMELTDELWEILKENEVPLSDQLKRIMNELNRSN